MVDATTVKEFAEKRISYLENKKNKAKTTDEKLEILYMISSFCEVIKFINWPIR